MVGAIFLLSFLFQIQPVQSGQPSVAPDAVAQVSCHFMDGDTWTPMQPAPVDSAGTKGLDAFVYTGGYTDLGMEVTFVGTEASLRLSQTPVFLIRPAYPANPAGADIDIRDAADTEDTPEPVLVRLQGKKGQRVCRTKLSLVDAENKHGFRKSDIVRTTVTVNPDKSLLVRPERKLKSGEYLLVAGAPAHGCDFGID